MPLSDDTKPNMFEDDPANELLSPGDLAQVFGAEEEHVLQISVEDVLCGVSGDDGATTSSEGSSGAFTSTFERGVNTSTSPAAFAVSSVFGPPPPSSACLSQPQWHQRIP